MGPSFRNTASSHAKRTSTTRLPAALRTELGLDGGASQMADTASGSERRVSTNGSSNGQLGDRKMDRRERAHFFAQQQRTNKKTSYGAAKQGRRGPASSSPHGVVGRKEARKAQRQSKKAGRAMAHNRPAFSTRPVEQGKKTSTAQSPQNVAPSTRSPTASSVTTSQSIKALGKRKAEDHVADQGRVQRRHVDDKTTTPLERLLQKQGGGRQKDDLANTAQEDGPPSNGKTASHSLGRRAPANTTERMEEDEITWLEANLGVGRFRKAKAKKATGDEDDDDQLSDGLDDLMDDLDRFYPGMYDEEDGNEDAAESDDLDDSDEDDGWQEEDSEEEIDQSELEYASDDEEEEEGDDDDDDDEDVDEEGESEGEGDSVGVTADEVVGPKKSENGKDDPAPTEQTDTIPSTSTGRYIPPALRRKMAEEQGNTISAEEQKLQRSIKGLLNRFGEDNLQVILSEVESLYRGYSRATVTNLLTKLIQDTIATNENMGDTLVVLYAALTAALHRIIGVEFGAHFIQELVDRFLRQYRAASRGTIDGPEAKEARNLISLLVSLYNLNVIACPLVYDLIRLLLGVDQGKKEAQSGMNELDIDLLLKVVKLCGAQLRHDDPSALKSIVTLAQQRQQSQAQATSVRAKFMLESLSDLRNNKSKATTASAGAEAVTKMRKFLGGLGKDRTIRTHEPLRVGLEDLCNVEKRGKWWLVGAAWVGYDLKKEEQQRLPSGGQVDVRSRTNEDTDQGQEAQLTLLARQHGMNTALRQQIFVTLLGSQDYLEAVQRLLALTHRRTNQRREIVRVLLHCLAREPAFNPFYVMVAVRLADEDQRGTQITLQYCLWDHLRKLGERNVGGHSILSRQEKEEEDEDDDQQDEQMLAFGGEVAGQGGQGRLSNVARAYGWWLAEGTVTLEAMRAIDFTSLHKGIPFLRLILVHLLLSVGVASPVHTLSSATKTALQARLEAVELVFVQGTRTNQRIAQGLLVFFEQHLTAKHCRSVARDLGLDQALTKVLQSCRSTALETVRVGARVAAPDEEGETGWDE